MSSQLLWKDLARISSLNLALFLLQPTHPETAVTSGQRRGAAPTKLLPMKLIMSRFKERYWSLDAAVPAGLAQSK